MNYLSRLRIDRVKVAVALLLIAFALWSRFVPHPANLTALTAVSLFGAVVLPRRWAVVVPVVSIILSDLAIGMHSLVWATWGSFALVAVLGYSLRHRLSIYSIGGASIAGSVLFYVVTNFAVWAEGRMYAMNWEGLMMCYYNALPFFRNMLVGDLFYVALLFGVYAAATATMSHRQRTLQLR